MPADALTKVLSAQRLRWLIRRTFGLDVTKNEAGSIIGWTPMRRILAAEIFRRKAGCLVEIELGAQLYHRRACSCKL